MSIFQNSVLKEYSKNIDKDLVSKRWKAFQNWQKDIEAIKTYKEEIYQEGFLRDIFENCLGYTLNTTNKNEYNLEREKKNETDSKKADGVIYVNNKVVGVIELKGQDTKNLDRGKNKESSPIEQAFGYLTSHDSTYCKYVIVSNFDELRFYIKDRLNYEKFNLFNLNEEEFYKLHLLISYESIKENIPSNLKDKSTTKEIDISKDLYKKFSSFRTSLFENLVKNNTTHDKATLLRFTQKLCDRIIFILFAEDRGLLRTNIIEEIKKRHEQDLFDISLYGYYKIYFEAINQGSLKLDIPQYNGGLFAIDEELDNLVIDDEIINSHVPILSKFDFASEISVNILGHIFEQSLTDLEELQANIDNVNFDKTKSKRKKDGVFYTPEYITRYIVENTLGKMCSEKREELNLLDVSNPTNPKKLTKQEKQTLENIYSYRDYLLNLKILDPACGSGAFLNQALEFLIKEHDDLDKLRKDFEGEGLGLYDIEASILEHNLYGVDINEDAIEIAKLSLWLRSARRGRPLTKLANKIKCGNSLINDKNIVSNAFIWEEEFKEVFEQGGFDIVIGNPPYVDNRGFDKDILNYYFKIYNNSFGKSGTESYKTTKFNLIAPFIELTYKLLRYKGLTSFIIHKNIFKTNSYSNIRRFILQKYKIEILTDWGSGQFEDVVAETATFIFEKDYKKNNDFKIEFYKLNQKINETYESQDTYLLNYDNIFSIYTNTKDRNVLFKIKNNSLSLSNIVNINNGIVTGDDKKYLFSTQENDTFKPSIRGKDISRYSTIIPKEFIKYDKNSLLRARDENIFLSNEKLIMQMINTKFIITYDNQQVYNLGTTYALTLKDKNFDLKYVLCILLSKLINWYYKKEFTNESELTNAISTKNLFEIPLKNLNIIEQEPFIAKANKMLELNKKLQETKQNFINELNLEKVPTKLQKFEELDFDDFVKEYAKAKKLKFADKLEERNFKSEWQRLFENDKKEVLEIQNQINITDKEIDQMVYKLYDLNEDEIKIVESI
ncbi:Eco57I restriction-modification methylase domain-containing protein [Arcobacter porcinus]|uniref:Eco57I restriction-modification methylase domain-containing protein n=1 Tax=Arcobacter porcinus TaxID=1935204 RepID=UPI000826A159|nr:TaqI-like C-terminal specificity domain-containing protein [Arcobacter porcinus]OCL86170.1 Type IIS restriction enzyme Eco57I [Arcobacter porcinus]